MIVSLSFSLKKITTLRDRDGGVIAHFEAPSDVRALSPKVDCHFGGEVLCCCNIVHGDVVSCGHDSYDLDGDSHDDIARLRPFLFAQGFVPTPK